MISVIVPVYNCGKYLRDCLLSIYSQTLKDYEIIAVNDASTDNSADILEQISQEYGNLIIVNMPKNSGLSAARNAGMEKANGDYICYVDSDDTIQPDYLEALYKAAIDNNADLVIGDYREVDENLTAYEYQTLNGSGLSEHDIKRQSAPYKDGEVSREELVGRFSVSYLDHYAIASVVAWNKLIRADIAKQCKFREGFIHEDEFWIMPLLMQCSKIVWTGRVIYNYRIRQGSITRSEDKAWQHVEVLDAYEARINTVDNKQLQRKIASHYFGSLLLYYLQLYCDYGIDKKLCHKFFSERTKSGLKKYGRLISKKERFKLFVFTINEALFFRVFWKKKLK